MWKCTQHHLIISCDQSLSCVDSLQPHGLYSTRLFCPWNFPGKNIGVGFHVCLQGTFPTHGLNRITCFGRQITNLPLCYLGSPSLIIKEMQIKPMRYHFTSTRATMSFLFSFAHAKNGILVTDQGSKLCFLQWKHRVLTTGLPGKPLG